MAKRGVREGRARGVPELTQLPYSVLCAPNVNLLASLSSPLSGVPASLVSLLCLSRSHSLLSAPLPSPSHHLPSAPSTSSTPLPPPPRSPPACSVSPLGPRHLQTALASVPSRLLLDHRLDPRRWSRPNLTTRRPSGPLSPVWSSSSLAPRSRSMSTVYQTNTTQFGLFDSHG